MKQNTKTKTIYLKEERTSRSAVLVRPVGYPVHVGDTFLKNSIFYKVVKIKLD